MNPLNSAGQHSVRLDISGQFVVNAVTPEGGWSKGRPLALIEAGDTWSIADLLIPNGLSDRALETSVGAKFSSFVVAGKTDTAARRSFAWCRATRSMKSMPRAH